MVSTDEVYGSLGPTGAFTETLAAPALQPLLGVEGQLRICSRWPTTTPSGWTWWSRAARTTTGRYQFPEKLIPLMVVNALHDKPLPVYGDGGNVRDWLHVEDHCPALVARAREGQGRARSTTSAAAPSGTNLEIVKAILLARWASPSR